MSDMAVKTTGRTIDQNGHPINGTGFDYDSEDRLAELLNQRISPLYSQPITGCWVFGLVARAETGGAYERGVGIFSPGNAGPPEHYHPTYAEHFDIVAGDFIFRLAGTGRRASAGDQVVLRKGTPDTFRCVGGKHGVVVVEAGPGARAGRVVAVLLGMAG